MLDFLIYNNMTKELWKHPECYGKPMYELFPESEFYKQYPEYKYEPTRSKCGKVINWDEF